MARLRPYLTRRIAINLLVDGALAAVAVALSFWLAAPNTALPSPLFLPLAGAVAIWLIGVPFGVARLQWRFVSAADLAAIAGACIVVALMLSLLLVGSGVRMVSPAFPIILALVLVVMLTAPKLVYRLLRKNQSSSEAGQSAVLIGHGEDAELFLNANARSAAPLQILGLLALSAKQIGRRVHGLDVIGAADDTVAALRNLPQPPDLIIIIAPEFTGDALDSVLAQAQGLGLRVLRAPSLTRLAPAERKLELQPIAIEDLLNRRQVKLDREGMAALVSGQRVLVTGAGGSIGSELARQVAGLNPSALMLLDHGEFALWQIDLEVGELYPNVTRQCVLGDVRDAARMFEICQSFRPALVFHAAALKHVPIVEAQPLEGLATNVIGTQGVADAARASGAALMVLISTDKAVNPSSVMGASKRLAEMYAQALDVEARRGQSGMRCVTVRFGNVLGSTGSVVPVFSRQLAAGGPLTVTHPDMQRYFMTVREAVGLVLQAAFAGSGEAAIPDGGIFVLDMGAPVKILDLAYQMIRLAGLRPGQDIAVKFTGLRPGEKLFEELFHGQEKPSPTEFEGLLMARPRLDDLTRVGAMITEIKTAIAQNNAETALASLARAVPEFGPPEPLAVCAVAE